MVRVLTGKKAGNHNKSKGKPVVPLEAQSHNVKARRNWWFRLTHGKRQKQFPEEKR
jgi:hypothetical protein